MRRGGWSVSQAGTGSPLSPSVCPSCRDPYWAWLIAERGQLHVAKTCGQYINENALHMKGKHEQSPRDRSLEVNEMKRSRMSGLDEKTTTKGRRMFSSVSGAPQHITQTQFFFL